MACSTSCTKNSAYTPGGSLVWPRYSWSQPYHPVRTPSSRWCWGLVSPCGRSHQAAVSLTSTTRVSHNINIRGAGGGCHHTICNVRPASRSLDRSTRTILDRLKDGSEGPYSTGSSFAKLHATSATLLHSRSNLSRLIVIGGMCDRSRYRIASASDPRAGDEHAHVARQHRHSVDRARA